MLCLSELVDVIMIQSLVKFENGHRFLDEYEMIIVVACPSCLWLDV